ncbi:hypothetical protein FQR65_LT20704 [Abscondita terminalis]|nr:hypothetical protein FQR65_LT20704 [Abscondita terminalis]
MSHSISTPCHDLDTWRNGHASHVRRNTSRCATQPDECMASTWHRDECLVRTRPRYPRGRLVECGNQLTRLSLVIAGRPSDMADITGSGHPIGYGVGDLPVSPHGLCADAPRSEPSIWSNPRPPIFTDLTSRIGPISGPHPLGSSDASYSSMHWTTCQGCTWHSALRFNELLRAWTRASIWPSTHGDTHPPRCGSKPPIVQTAKHSRRSSPMDPHPEPLPMPQARNSATKPMNRLQTPQPLGTKRNDYPSRKTNRAQLSRATIFERDGIVAIAFMARWFGRRHQG